MRVGLLGLGEVGGSLARALIEAGQEIVAAADPDLGRLGNAERLSGRGMLSASPRALVQTASVEVLVIALARGPRFVLAAEALEAGKHVLVLGPPAQTVREAECLLDLARSRDRLLLSAYRAPHAPGPQEMRRLLRGQEATPLRLMTSRRTVSECRAPGLFDALSEDVALFAFLLSREPEWVSAVQDAIATRAPARVTVTLRYAGGPVVQIEVSIDEEAKRDRIAVHAGNQRLVLDQTGGSSAVWIDSELLWSDGEESPEAAIVSQFLVRLERAEPIESASALLDARVDVIRVLEALQQSLESGGEPVGLRSA